MESREYKEELKAYKKILSSKDNQKEDTGFCDFLGEETLNDCQHRMILEDSSSDELLGIYDDLKDLELVDLCDFFKMERGDGRI